ncbi:MAG: hypothetical protein EKK64_09130 [Neisseriaceae bacterium]|jgi:hypothetical protein|nr:MAG: hypothetical protein EKK64_09130 [Neisseriaceae bacterium]
MNLKELLLEAHSYAKPVVWRIFGFNVLLMFMLFICGFLSVGSFVLIASLTAKGNEFPIYAFLLFLFEFCFIYILLINTFSSITKYIVDFKSDVKPTFSSLLRNLFRFNFRYLKLNLWFIVLLIPTVICSVIVLALVSSYTSQSSDAVLLVWFILAFVWQIVMYLFYTPVFMFSSFKIVLTSDEVAIKALKDGLKMLFKSIKLSIIPVLLCFISLFGFQILGISYSSNMQTNVVSDTVLVSSSIELIIVVLIVFLIPYFIAYYLAIYNKLMKTS